MREKKNKQKLWLMVVAVLIQLSCAFSVLKPKTTNKENGKQGKCWGMLHRYHRTSAEQILHALMQELTEKINKEMKERLAKKLHARIFFFESCWFFRSLPWYRFSI